MKKWQFVPEKNASGIISKMKKIGSFKKMLRKKNGIKIMIIGYYDLNKQNLTTALRPTSL